MTDRDKRRQVVEGGKSRGERKRSGLSTVAMATISAACAATDQLLVRKPSSAPPPLQRGGPLQAVKVATVWQRNVLEELHRKS
eukprot:CAMPEP_0171191694 /NCGR_PEP_ID=MMETSP0790-20130122/19494_1 /TAXON_ID=2925 /ORGANISM="Alexandrium catenella, Strain OF101" /LENGTH=82 /DNA_ID=CAMNT_0011656845 /DNA_START=74 /DNA_END=322 /DNA_ORIENTATION=+